MSVQQVEHSKRKCYVPEEKKRGRVRTWDIEGSKDLCNLFFKIMNLSVASLARLEHEELVEHKQYGQYEQI
jgi:hypothetical protein